jgi:aspartate/methionine/tyrosine aminotransferase
VGYCIASAELTDALRKVHDFTAVCAPTPLQEAMAEVIGLPDSYYQWLQTFYASRRSRMLGILDKHGFKYAVPEGAYYVMADFRHLGRGDRRRSRRIQSPSYSPENKRVKRLTGLPKSPGNRGVPSVSRVGTEQPRLCVHPDS